MIPKRRLLERRVFRSSVDGCYLMVVCVDVELKFDEIVGLRTEAT